MKRELKFRIWDKENEIFHYTEDIMTHIELLNGNRMTNGKIVAFPKITLTGQTGKPVNKISADPSNYKIHQSTGCFDMNKKEIYEGDAIRYHGRIGIVEFFVGSFICCWPDQTDDNLGTMVISDIEIIGTKNE